MAAAGRPSGPRETKEGVTDENRSRDGFVHSSQDVRNQFEGYEEEYGDYYGPDPDLEDKVDPEI